MFWRRRPPREEAEVPLGSVVLPTGLLVIGDMGYLSMWSGEDEPQPPEFARPDLQARMAAAKDLRVVGPDADAAARVFDRQSLTYLYDIPEPEAFNESFDEIVAPAGLDASLEQERRRVAHAERARRAGAAGGADFLINGVGFAAIDGLPVRTPLRIVGRRADFGPSVGTRWETVSLEVGTDEVATTQQLGFVGVDWARIIFADVACLNDWVHEDSLDGRADFVYWGADAEECRGRFGGVPLGEGEFGWENLPVEEMDDQGSLVEAWRDENGKKLGADFRPHSHHFRIMRDVRAHEYEVGELELAGGRVLAMMTSWGDGIFPVEIDRGADGAIVAVRVRLGDEDRRRRIEGLFARQ